MTQAVKGQPLGFEVVGVLRAGQRRSVARFTCCKCETATHDALLTSGVRLNPTLIAQQAEMHGWLADSVRKSRVVCPDCRKGKPNDVESELTKVRERMATSPLAIGTASAPVVPVREPSPDQRSTIRHLLEKHFDEGAGYYLDGYSDQSIAEAAGVPRIVVERLRDAAYGPIKVTAETIAARAKLDELNGRLNQLSDDALQWAQSFGADLERVRAEIGALRSQLGMKQTAA